jgi:hypothetical protein
LTGTFFKFYRFNGLAGKSPETAFRISEVVFGNSFYRTEYDMLPDTAVERYFLCLLLTGTDYAVVTAIGDGLHESRDFLWGVLAIGIKDNEDLRIDLPRLGKDALDSGAISTVSSVLPSSTTITSSTYLRAFKTSEPIYFSSLKAGIQAIILVIG